MNLIKHAFTPFQQMFAAVAIFAMVLSLVYGAFPTQFASATTISYCHVPSSDADKAQKHMNEPTTSWNGHDDHDADFEILTQEDEDRCDVLVGDDEGGDEDCDDDESDDCDDDESDDEDNDNDCDENGGDFGGNGQGWDDNDCDNDNDDSDGEITIVTHKIVCTDETDLPNWGSEGGPDITGTTASEWVVDHESCDLVSGWDFEWVNNSVTTDPGDTLVGPAGGAWTTFGATDANGMTETTISESALNGNSKIWLREVLKAGYIPFTHEANPDNSNAVSAEFYCNNDVINYDNYEWIDGIQFGNNYEGGDARYMSTNETYHCVAWNVLKETPKLCTVTLVSDTNTTVVEKADAGAKILSWLHPAWTAAIAGASWIWGDDPVAAPVNGVTQNFERKFGWNGPVTSAKLTIAADNTFVAELNGDAVGSDLTEFNYVAPTTEYNVTSLIDQGNNELAVEVYNMIHSTDPAVNPAGLLFKLEVTGTNPECNVPYVEEPKQCLVVSDVTTEVGGNPATLTWIHPAWTTELVSGTAEWIWDATVEPRNGETLTFTKKFNVDNVPTLATLKVAADNGYTVSLNGNPLTCDGTGDSNFSSVDTCSAPVIVGVNTLTFTATNAPWDTDSSTENPAGLIYELTIDGSSCSPVPVEILGCMDDAYDNYDPKATKDDGSCANEEVSVCEIGQNLLTNGSFEAPDVTNVAQWDIFPSGTPTLGWTVAWADLFGGSPTPANMELHDGVNGWLASEGAQYAELDSDWGGPSSAQTGEAASTRISQTVATVPGNVYELSFDFSARPGTGSTNNVLELLVDDVVEGTFGDDGSANGNTVWNNLGYQFEADSASTEIAFRDAGTPNSEGTLLDNAVLCLIEENPHENLIGGYKWNDEDGDGYWDEETEDGIEGWVIHVTNGDVTYTTTTNADGYYSFSVSDGDWTVSEEEQSGWEQTAPETNNGTCLANFGPTNEARSFSSTEGTIGGDVVDSECNFGNHYTPDDDEPEETNRSGGGGGSSPSPRCEAFDLEDDTLSWKTKNGFDLSIDRNGVEIFDTTDDDDVDEGDLFTVSAPGDIFELTVNRGSKDDTCTIELPDGEVQGDSTTRSPQGEVLGDSITVTPAGAPNTGAGGAASNGAFVTLIALFGMIASLVTIRRTQNV